jgi:hypothetical protein
MTSELNSRLMANSAALNAKGKSIEEMKRLIGERRMLRAEAQFQRAIDQYEQANPLPAIRESFRVIA